jgi:hypothetical protein
MHRDYKTGYGRQLGVGRCRCARICRNIYYLKFTKQSLYIQWLAHFLPCILKWETTLCAEHFCCVGRCHTVKLKLFYYSPLQSMLFPASSYNLICTWTKNECDTGVRRYKSPVICCSCMQTVRDVKVYKEQGCNTQHTIIMWHWSGTKLPTVGLHRKITMLEVIWQRLERVKSYKCWSLENTVSSVPYSSHYQITVSQQFITAAIWQTYLLCISVC